MILSVNIIYKIVKLKTPHAVNIGCWIATTCGGLMDS